MENVNDDLAFVIKDSGKRKEFSTGMQRDVTDNKPRFDLIIPECLSFDKQMLTRWAKHMEGGAKKYSERNWEKASTQEELTRFKESALRHCMQWFCGETDEDHAAAVFFNISGAEMVKVKLIAKDKVEQIYTEVQAEYLHKL
jgi:hypothetical protein